MFKPLFALVRGRSHETAQSVVDRNAITILNQQIRDCAQAIATARKAVAVTIAQNEQESRQHKKLQERITDLEKRTVIAIEKGEDELARDAAETIALLEAESETSKSAQENFKKEIERLKKILRESETRLRELKRGQRLANATDKTQRLRQSASGTGLSTLNDAEETLERLRNRQSRIDATATAMDEISMSGDPSLMSKRLAEAGCGTPLKSSADDVLERLSKKVRKPA